MVTIQPFQYEKTTAFKERVQIANKVNEIINLFNELDIEGKINVFNEEIAIINGKITEINNALNEVNAAVNTVEGYNNRLVTVENKNTEQDSKITAIENKNSEQDTKININTSDLDNIKNKSFDFESGKKTFKSNSHTDILGTYTNKTVTCLMGGKWVRVYYNDSSNSNQIMLLTVNGQKGNNGECTGLISCYMNNSTIQMYGIGRFNETSKNNILGVQTVNNVIEIWAHITDANHGLMFSRICEYNWGSVSNNFNQDGETVADNIDYTNTELYKGYGFLI